MAKENDFTRILDKEHRPTDREIIKTIGLRATKAWNEVRSFLERYYDFTPELCFYGKKYGWTIRYRKSGKTLCALFPESGAFTVLIVLGRKDVEKVNSTLDEFGTETRATFQHAKQYPDGKWLWIRVRFKKQTVDIEKLIKLKKKPKDKSA